MKNVCETCNKKLIVKFASGRFCSRSCSNMYSSRVKRQQINNKLSKKLTGKKFINGKWQNVIYVCQECNSKLLRKQKYCDDCRLGCISKNIKKSLFGKNVGGYREGSGRSKHGYYKGIYFGSTYELVWFIYMVDHGHKPERFKGFIFYDKNKKYFPDFILDGKIFEIKGFDYNHSVPSKVLAAKAAGYQIEVLYKSDLKIHFNWVKNKYGKNIISLFESKKFDKQCIICNVKFTTTSFERKCCSRTCSGKLSKNMQL